MLELIIISTTNSTITDDHHYFNHNDEASDWIDKHLAPTDHWELYYNGVVVAHN